MRKTLKAVTGLFVLLGIVFFANAAPSGAQECGGYLNPCPEPTLEFTFPSVVQSGGSIHITGSCNVPDEPVVFTIGDQEIGTITPEDDGSFDVTLDVPNLAAGDYTISGTCGDLVADGTLTVTTTTTPTTPTTPINTVNTTSGTTSGTPLARTGFDAAPMVTLGAAALVLGAAAVYGSKRRRTA